jgi:hypothetical protein
MPIEDPDPRISVVENRADNAKALFELLEQRRKQAAEAQLRSPGQPVQNQVSPALGSRAAPGTLPAPGLGAAPIKPAKPVSELPERLEDFPSTASTRALTGTIDHESSLDELKDAISKGKFDVKSYLGAVDNMPGGIHGLLTPEEVEKMQEAYRFQMTKPVSPAVVAKTAVTGAVTTAPAIVRGAYKTGKDLASIELGVRRAALGDKSGLKDAEAASAEIVAGAEVGFLGAADAARRGIRRGVDVLKQAATGDVKSITDVALSANPLMVPFNIFGVRPTDFIPGSKKEDAKSLTPTDPDLWRQRFWEDIASAKQMDLASRGEGEFGKAAIGGGERTARQVALDATGEWDEKAPGDIGMIYNPYMAAGTIANLLKRARAGGLTPRPAQIKAPPAKAPPQPRLGGAMTATGEVIERSGTSAIRHVVPGVGFAGYTFGPTGAILGATMPWIIRWAGRKMKKAGQARAKGGASPDPNFGVALAQGVKENVLKPYYEGAKGAALHPMTIGLAAFADDDQEMGHIFGGAAAFGGVTHLGIHTVNVGAGRAHGVLMADRIKQTQLREEPFDPDYGRHAEPTQRNLQRMSESDRTVVNILRNKVRQANVAEPDMDAIRAQPPKLNAREWVTEQISSETGQIGYRTNLGRVVSPTEAGRIAWEAGQPLRDVTYQVEIVASDPETASAVSNPEMSHSLGANASGSKRGVVNAYREGDAGRIEVHLNSDAFSAYHELGHALDFARHPGERLGLRNELLQTHGEQSIEAFRRFYAELLASGELAALQRARASAVDPQLRAQIDTRIDSVRRTGYWKPDPGMPPRDASRPQVVGDAGQSKFVVDDGAGKRSVVDMNTAIDIADANGQTRVSRDIALDEASAEMQSMMLKSRSLQGLPESSRQKVAGALASLLEDVGLYKPGFSATQGQYTRMQRPGDPTSPSSTARQQSTLGLEASMNAERAYWRNLRSVAGPQRIPGAVDIAPPGPEFFGTEGPGGTAQQRVAGGLTPGEPVAAADRPIVQPPAAPTGAAPVVTPKGPTPVRPGIVTREENRTVVDTGRATDAEVNSILQGLRDSGLPEAEIARLEPMLRAKGGTVELTYASGTPELLPPAELARERRAERRATYEREQGAVNEELRKIAPETRTKFTRKFVPYRVIVRPALNPDGTTTVQANVLGLSPSKILQNAIILDRTVRNINAKVAPEQRMVLPFQEPAERGQAVYNYERLYRALEQYTENQANGYTGAGEKLTRPEGFIEVLPEPVEGYTPHKLPQIEASFINMLMGVEPPATTRSTKRLGAVTPEGIRAIPTGEKVQAGIETVEVQPKAVSAFQLSEAQAPGRGVPSPTRDVGIAGPRTAPAKPWEVSVPTRAMRKGMPATEVKKGTFKDPKTGVEFDIQEFNQLRAEITDKARRAGLKEFDLNDHLAEAFEELNAELLESVRVSPREEGPQLRYPSETMVEAGFLPEEGFRPEEVKARVIPAIKTAEGRVILGERGKTHDDIYKSMGMDGLMLQVEGPEHGFIDPKRPSEFMSREQAGEKTGVKGRLHSQDLIESKAMPEASPELQARAEAKKQTIRENEGVGIGVNRRTKAATYPAKSQSGKAAEQDGFSLNQWESDGGFGIVQMKNPEGKRVGDVIYRVRESDSGELDYHVQFIDVLPEWRGDAARFEGNNAAAILYRELAETAKENGVLRISGDPISERAMALRMKVFEQTEVTDPVSEAPLVKAEDLRAAIQDSGGLIPFMKEQGMFELTSFFRENQRFLPEEAEVPVMASVRLKRGAGGKGETFDGAMHLFAYTKAREKTGSTDFADFEEGFKTSKGRFVSRQEAADLANRNAGLVVRGELMAEELPAQREAIRVAQDLNLQFQGSPLEGRWQFHDPVTRSGFTARAGEPIEAIRQRLEATRQEFGEERAMPKEQRDLELKHYSNVPNLKVLDPAKHGTGIQGAEATRRRDYPEIYLPRTYYGLKGYKKEPGLGPYTYESAIKSSRVYDFLKDPDNFYPDSTELRDAGYAPLDQTAAVTLYENRIAKKYDGFKNTSVKVAALFKKQPVKQVGESRALPGEADLFGQVDYEGKAIQGMSDRQLRSHFPEAIVPKGRQPKRIEYDLAKAPLVKGLDPEQAAGKYADKIKEFYESVKDQPEVQAGRRWYSEFTPELKKAFGKDAPLFAELLAATSPNTAPEINFGFAADAFFNFKAGRYDASVKTFMQGLRLSETGEWKTVYQQAVDAGAKRTGTGEPTQAEFMAWWIADNNLKPRGSGGKLIGMHSTRVLQVLARKWMETNEGPKTQTFVSNLLGAGHEATIDVWAARTMRRLGYEGSRERWRILPENSASVSDADFALAQKAFKQASRDLGMRPSSLQGALWFAEKKLWADRGWGRLDLGDFRSEMKKLNLLKTRFTESEAVRARAKDIEATEQEDLFGGG